MLRKHNADKIQSHLEGLVQEYKCNRRKELWPKFLFRVENIISAANILNSGVLYSRNAAIQHSLNGLDSACEAILDHTENTWKQHVRLYFRPLTAYHYATEGIRPTEEIIDVHCPVPVLLLFDSSEILTRENTSFSDGNLSTSNVRVGDNYTFFNSIPFDSVYKIYKKSDRNYRQIKFHNQAEVMVPDKLSLDSLRYVVCRSQPERETLLSLLHDNKLAELKNEIGKNSVWFTCKYKYVQDVQVVDDGIRFNFGAGMDADYQIQAKIRSCANGMLHELPLVKRHLNEYIVLKQRDVMRAGDYEVELYLDSHLAYKKTFISDDVPF